MFTHRLHASTLIAQARAGSPRSPSTAKKAVFFLAVFAGFIQTAFAGGTSTATPSLKFAITDATGQPIQSQDISSIVSFDPTTGDLSTPAVGTPLTGNWSWSSTDLTTGQPLVLAVLQWHTDSRVNNLDPTSPWLSIVQLQATGNVDPFMSYSFAAKNNTTANQTFAFSYGESIVTPVASNYSINADVAGSLTHAAISPVAQLTPTLGDFDGDGIAEIQTLKLSTDNGLTFTNAGVDVGPTQSRTPTGTLPFGTYSDAKIGSLASVNYWQFDVAFSLTPNKDAASLSGSADIESLSNIPEPSTYALLVSTVALGAVLLRRRRATARPKA